MDFCGVRLAQLATSQGAFVCVQSKRTSHQLVTKKQQVPGRDNYVKVYEFLCDKDQKCMAFCFEMEGKSIFPVVTHGEDVKFKVSTSQTIFPESFFEKSFLFQWSEKGSGLYGSLKSVAEPSKYLFVHKEKVTIGSQDMPDFYIRYREERKGMVFKHKSKVQENVKTRRKTLKRGYCAPKGQARR